MKNSNKNKFSGLEIYNYSSGDYWQKNIDHHELDAEFKFQKARKLLKKNNITPRSILDCGCGSGKDSYLLVSHFNVETLGIDISKHAILSAKIKFNHPKLFFKKKQVSQLKGRWSLGIMFDVFEHVEDYYKFLRVARKKADFWIFNIPLDMNMLSIFKAGYMKARSEYGHLHYFFTDSAIATLRECGYEVVDSMVVNSVLHDIRTKKKITGMLAALPRLILSIISPNFSARLLGGAALMVLCRNPD